MDFALSILLVYGITNIVVQSSLFEPLRSWVSKKVDDNMFWLYFYRLITCMMCFGFWVGAFVGYFFGPFVWWNVIFNGAIFSGTTWIIHCLVQFLGNGYDPSRTINIVTSDPLLLKEVKDENPKH